MSIMIGLAIVALLLALGTWYVEDGLKLVFLLLTGLAMQVILTVVALVNQTASIQTILWVLVTVGAFLYLILFLYAMVKLTVALRIRKNPPPKINSPLDLVKANRKAKKGKY